MIKQLRARLIAAAMLALSLVLLVIIGGINGMSYRKTLSDADAILSVLASNEGMFPQRTPPAGAEESPPPGTAGRQPAAPARNFRRNPLRIPLFLGAAGRLRRSAQHRHRQDCRRG